MLDLVAGGALGIPVHRKGQRKCSASWRAGRLGFLSTPQDDGNARPKGRAGRLGFLSTQKDKRNARPRGGRDAWARPLSLIHI